MGSGGALFDYDNDGDLDVYVVQGSPLDAPARDGGRLFRNELDKDQAAVHRCGPAKPASD